MPCASASTSHTESINVQHTAAEDTWSRTRQFLLATPARHIPTCSLLPQEATALAPFRTEVGVLTVGVIPALGVIPAVGSAAGPSTKTRISISRVVGEQLLSQQLPQVPDPDPERPEEIIAPEGECRRVGGKSKNRLLLTEGNISFYYRNYK